MPGTIVQVPRFLHELHGERTTRAALVATYVAALSGALVVLFVPEAGPDAHESGAWWRVVVTALVAADLFGGVVANFTSGTSAYYRARPRLRVVFIASHVIQPLALWLLADGAWLPWLVVSVYTLAGAFAVNAIRNRHVQEPLAAALVAIGILAVTAVPAIRPALLWFTPVYLVKLVLGFSVGRADGTSAS